MRRKIMSAFLIPATTLISGAIWASSYRMQPLDRVPIPGFADSINNSGVVMGNSTFPNTSIFVWSGGTGVVEVRQDGITIGVNEGGQMAGNRYEEGVGRLHPRIEYADGTIVDYAVPEGAFLACALCMNDKGEIGATVGYKDNDNNLLCSGAVIYGVDGSFTTIPIQPSLQAGVRCLNNTGYAVVDSIIASDPRVTNYYI